METTDVPRVKVKWPTKIENGERSMDGVTHTLTRNGAYIRCAKPLKLNEICDIVIDAAASGQKIRANVEVVWSNIYGPDDEISPRGMGVLFLDISDEDRLLISKVILQHLESNKEKMDPKKLQNFQTLVIDESKIASKAA